MYIGRTIGKKWFSTASGLLIKVSQITKTVPQTLMAHSWMTGISSPSSMLKSTHKVGLWAKRSRQKWLDEKAKHWRTKPIFYFGLSVSTQLSSEKHRLLFWFSTKLQCLGFGFFFPFRLSWRCHSFLPNKYLWVMHILTPGSAILIYGLCSCMWKCGAAPSWQAVQLPSGTAPWPALRLDSFQQL